MKTMLKRIHKYIFHPHYGVLRTCKDPDVLRGHIRMRVLKQINNKVGEYRHKGEAENIMQRDWDTLIILDACRYDTFAEEVEMDGKLTKRQSIAPETSRFIQRTFGAKKYHDTVYVSSNPKVSALTSEDTFHKIIPVWQHEWDKEVGSVRPETVTRFAKEANETFPNKRLIIHYMQPHQPFVGPLGRDFMKTHNLRGINKFSEDNDQLKLYPAMRYGLLETSDETLLDLYRENLVVALNSIQELVPHLDGKTVITSDHGELIGDTVGILPMKGYGHPSPLHVSELVTVPWFELPFKSRREIYSERPEESVEVDTEVVEERLNALGYTDIH